MDGWMDGWLDRPIKDVVYNQQEKPITKKIHLLHSIYNTRSSIQFVHTIQHITQITVVCIVWASKRICGTWNTYSNLNIYIKYFFDCLLLCNMSCYTYNVLAVFRCVFVTSDLIPQVMKQHSPLHKYHKGNELNSKKWRRRSRRRKKSKSE